MLWLGITGSLGSGKSTVSGLVREAGYSVIDADFLAHQALGLGTDSYNLIVASFGQDILNSDKTIDRKKLAHLVFVNPQKLNQLESFVHPYVQTQVEQFRLEQEKKGSLMAFYDVPLLFEKNLQGQFDAVIVVSTKAQLQAARLRKRNSWSDEEIHTRLQNQLPLAEKEKRADYLIENNGSLDELKEQVQLMLQNFRAKC